MRRHLLALSGAVLALSLSACENFAHGVVDRPLANDPGLIGYWRTAGEKPDAALLIAATGPAGLDLVAYSHEEDGSCQKQAHLNAVRTRIGDRDFLDVTALEIQGDKPGHLLVPIAYELTSPERLTLLAPDLDAFALAIDAKELPGSVSRIPKADLVLSFEVQAPTEDLRRWIAAHPGAIGPKPVDFVRGDPAKAPHCREGGKAAPRDLDGNPLPPTRPLPPPGAVPPPGRD